MSAPQEVRAELRRLSEQRKAIEEEAAALTEVLTVCSIYCSLVVLESVTGCARRALAVQV